MSNNTAKQANTASAINEKFFSGVDPTIFVSEAPESTPLDTLILPNGKTLGQSTAEECGIAGEMFLLIEEGDIQGALESYKRLLATSGDSEGYEAACRVAKRYQDITTSINKMEKRLAQLKVHT